MTAPTPTFTIKRIMYWIIWLIVFILLITERPFVTIDSSERGVVYTLWAVQDEILWEWFHVIKPFISNVKVISIKPNTAEVHVAVDIQWAITKDNQTIGCDMTLFYRYPEWELINIAKNYWYEVIKKKAITDLNESFKQVIGTYTIFDVAANQEEIRDLVMSWLIEKIWEYPIYIDDVKITNYDWSDAFDQQIATTMEIAQQAKQQEQELKKIEISAQQQVVQAEANRQAEKLNAEALELKWEGIRKYNQAITSNPKNMELEIRLKELEIEKLRVEKWNWVYVSEQNYTPIPIQNGSLLWTK